MTTEVENKAIEKNIQNLEPYLSRMSKKELAQILEYGEKMKVEGERKKKEFWISHDREDFENLLVYKWKNQNELEGKYEYLGKLKGLERKKFVEEYLHDDILYSGEVQPKSGKGKRYEYDDLIKGNVIMEKNVKLDFGGKDMWPELLDYIFKMNFEEGVNLGLGCCRIGGLLTDALVENINLKRGMILSLVTNSLGPRGAKAISKIKLEEGVTFYLGNNRIGEEGAKAIAENLQLKKGVTLNLGRNGIGDEGVEALSHMELKEGVILGLDANGIGVKGVREILENMKLTKGSGLSLYDNTIRDEGAKVISHMKLVEGAILNLGANHFGKEGAKAIAENMELKEGVTLKLDSNDFGAEGAKAIAENMKLKKGVVLGLCGCNIGLEGVEYLSKMKLKDGVKLDLGYNEIGAKGAEVISKMELRDGVYLRLCNNGIGNEGVEYLSKMELKDGVILDLEVNDIGIKGAKAIAKNLKLKEGVELDLSGNQIGDEGLQAISEMDFKEGVNLVLYDCDFGNKGLEFMMENMKLKNGMKLDLRSGMLSHKISDDMKEKLKNWEKSYRCKGINCKIML